MLKNLAKCNRCYQMVTKVNKFQPILTDVYNKCKQMLLNVISTNFNKLQPIIPNTNKY